MTAELSPKQALFLWKLITAQTLEEREPMKSKSGLTVAERESLVQQGYLSMDQRGPGEHLVLTDKAWAWAERTHDVTLLRSNSNVGAIALEGLLRRLLPFLAERELPLASLFPTSPPREEKVATTLPSSRRPAAKRKRKPPLKTRIEQTCLDLSGGQRKRRVRLSALRGALGDVRKNDLDKALLALQDAGRAVLYRDDNSAGLTSADHDAALIVGGAPRHIIYLEA